MRTVNHGYCRAPILIFVTMLLLEVACAGLPHTSKTGAIQNIQIGDTLIPRELYAAVGDEVRWVNNRDTPVRIGFLGNTDLHGVSCEKGFQRFGTVQDIVTIPPHSYVSLCFSQREKVRYNIWWDLDDPRGAVSRTATIHVSMRHAVPDGRSGIVARLMRA